MHEVELIKEANRSIIEAEIRVQVMATEYKTIYKRRIFQTTHIVH